MKKIWKRLISTGLVIALVITMIHVIPRSNSSGTAYAEGQGEYVTRGVVDSIEQLPQSKYGVNNYYSIPRGSTERPFVVLEVVPYEELAEFGYLISGCEPVDIEKMRGNGDYMELLNSIAKGSVTALPDKGEGNQGFYFFLDEPQYQNENDYSWKGTTQKVSFPSNLSVNGLYGYYERVNSGGGLFEYKYIGGDDTEVDGEVDGEVDVVETENAENTQAGASIQTPEAEEAEQSEEQGLTGQEEQEEQTIQGNLTPEVGPTDEIDDNSEDNVIEEVSYHNQNSLVKTSEINEFENSSDNASQEETSSPDVTMPSVDDNESIQDGTDVSGEETPVEEEPSTDDTLEDGALQDEMGFPDETQNEEQQEEELSDEIALMALEEPEIEESETSQWKVGRAEDGNGYLVWHTITRYEKERLENSGVDFMAPIDNRMPQKVGDRLYTIRCPEDGEQVFKVTEFYDYVHNDDFLKRSLTLSDEAAENFCIVIKTITLDQLNNTPAWIDYADLIYLAYQQHAGGDNLREMWFDRNKLGRTSPTKPSDISSYDEEATIQYMYNHDIKGEVALKIYNKVTADSNFAAIIFEDNIFVDLPDNGRGKSVSTVVYNWYMKPATNIYGKQCDLYSATGCNSNLYKLYVMLMCMDPNLFKSIYLDGGYIKQNESGNLIVTLQQGDAATYWRPETFMLFPDNVYPSPINSFQKYWTEQCWDSYHYGTLERAHNDGYGKNWCSGHVFTFKGDTAFTQHFTGGLGTNLNEFPDFAAALKEYGKASPAEAVRYILGEQPNSNYYGYNQTLKVLDLEPSVGLVLNNNTEDATLKWLPNWLLTKTYVNMLLPHFKGNIEIEHQTTAEFIGKIEDLNTTYDLVYMGLDCSGYNTKAWDIGNGRIAVLPDWNDNSLDQKIYIRTGDLAMSKNYDDGYGYQSANWLYDKSTKTLANTGQRMRFAGNDISRLKKADLEDFLNAYYPIVAEQQLFDLDTRIIETNTYVYQLISEQKAQNKPIYGTSSTALIENAARNALGNAITFVESPVRYDGTTVSDTSPEFKNTNCYLPRNAYGNAYLYFKINAAASGYRYRIYVDLNRDSRFSDDEIMNDISGTKNVLAVGDNEYLQPLPSDWVGLLQWKAEVYLETNPSVRYEITGCSAVQRNASTSSGKKKVTVLHIMPEWGSGYQGALNLQTNGTFIKYYEDLEDYDVTITSISYDEYEKYFYYLDNRGQRKSWNFTYDYSKEVDDNNPYNLDKLHNDNYADLMDYNMIIVGFGDCYGSKNMTNQYGQMDFLRYFADQGRSILFTHDLTTFYNVLTTDLSFTANTQLRDIMGMNRYASVNYYLDTTIRNRLIADQAANADKYDTNYTPETHGFTYFAIKRMGQVDGQVYRMPYRNMVNNLQGNPIGEQGTGFNFDNDPTTQVSKVNEGQITVYPYKIDDNFKIAETHSQYYQLSPEDDNLTVWYCLAGDGDIAHSYGTGTSLTYAVSPNDTMENYYIYSKGNIFYSGVGHSTVTGDMEAKLFVNTMIAAYNAAYEPPKVEITNPEAISRGSFEYDIELMQSYDFDEHGNLVATASDYYDVNEHGELVYNVIFTPQDYNLASGTTLECQIQWENGDYVTEVVRLSDGAILHADSNNVFHNFTRGQEYSLEYPMKYLSDYHWEKTIDGELKSGEYIRTISFSIKNNRVDAKNITVLNINVLPLFPLD